MARSLRNKLLKAGRPFAIHEPAAQTHAERYWTWGLCALLLLAVAVVFGQTVRFALVNFDDNVYVYKNLQVQKGLTWPGVVWAFTQFHALNWHPLTWLSHMLDYECYGLWPGGHHLTSVLLHAATVVLLFLVLWQMTARRWPSALVAVLFAIHPLHVESVAWVAERKDVLSGLFFVLTLAAYLGYIRRPFSLARYLLVVLCFVLGLLAKPMLVTLPFVLWLLDYWPLRRWNPLGHWERANGCPFVPAFPPRVLLEKIPLLLLAAASCVATTLAQTAAIMPLERIPWSVRAGNALVSYVAYLGQYFWPADLAVYYPYPQGGPSWWAVAGALLLLLGISAAAVLTRRRHPYFLMGWLWFLGMLVPVIGLVQVGTQARADRYMYLPLIGPALAVAWATYEFVGDSFGRRWLCGAAWLLVLVALLDRATEQTSTWRDDETLWTHTFNATAGNALAHYNLALALAECGQLDDAADQYRQALDIKPDYAEAHLNLGNDLLTRRRLDEAIAHYQRALAINADYAQAHNNLGSALMDRGHVAAAIEHYRQALKINPDYTGAHVNLGIALASCGHVDAAIAHYQRAVEIEPDYADAHVSLSGAFYQKGRLDEAAACLEKALALKPDYAGARQHLAMVQAARAKLLQALAGRREALRGRPDDTALLNDTAWMLATNPNASIRNGVEAVELAQRAVRLAGGRDPALLGTLAAAYAEAGHFADAARTAHEALALAAKQHKAALVESVKSKIPLYEAGVAFRQFQR